MMWVFDRVIDLQWTGRIGFFKSVHRSFTYIVVLLTTCRSSVPEIIFRCACVTTAQPSLAWLRG